MLSYKPRTSLFTKKTTPSVPITQIESNNPKFFLVRIYGEVTLVNPKYFLYNFLKTNLDFFLYK